MLMGYDLVVYANCKRKWLLAVVNLSCVAWRNQLLIGLESTKANLAVFMNFNLFSCNRSLICLRKSLIISLRISEM